MQRGSSALYISLVCFVLILFNFGFDYNRRFNFTNAQIALEQWRKDLQDKCSKAQDMLDKDVDKAMSLTNQFEIRSKAEAEAVEAIKDMISDLYKRIDEQNQKLASKGKEGSTTEEVQTEGTQATKEGNADNKNSISLLDTPTDKMLSRMEKARNSDKYEDQMWNELIITDNWKDSDALLHDFEQHYGVTLDDEERQKWILKLGAYKNLMITARNVYESSLDDTVFKIVDRDGIEKYASVLPPLSRAERDNIIASISQGKINMRLMKDDYPDLFRKSNVRGYIPYVIMDEVRDFFKERKVR